MVSGRTGPHDGTRAERSAGPVGCQRLQRAGARERRRCCSRAAAELRAAAGHLVAQLGDHRQHRVFDGECGGDENIDLAEQRAGVAQQHRGALGVAATAGSRRLMASSLGGFVHAVMNTPTGGTVCHGSGASQKETTVAATQLSASDVRDSARRVVEIGSGDGGC